MGRFLRFLPQHESDVLRRRSARSQIDSLVQQVRLSAIRMRNITFHFPSKGPTIWKNHASGSRMFLFLCLERAEQEGGCEQHESWKAEFFLLQAA